MASALEEFPLRAVQNRIRGFIAGVEHIGAATTGDGACGLHSVFGMPRATDMFLECANARSVVVCKTPGTLEELFAQCSGGLRRLCLRVMKFVWTDLALPSARAIINGEPEPTPEARSVWYITGSHLQPLMLPDGGATSGHVGQRMAAVELGW